MTPADGGDETTLAPEDAFSVLGNETRMDILRILAEANEPLAFSALYERASATDSGNFTYHLDKLLGHFVENNGDGYNLRRAGERIVEAVVSGAVTETPVIEPTRVDWPCSQCGASSVVSYQQEWVAVSCPDCAGLFSESEAQGPVPDEQLDQGYLGGASLPPAGVEGRDAGEVIRAALAWDFLERMALSKGICPRCSAAVERTLSACENHDASEGLCDTCERRYQDVITVECPSCPLTGEMVLPAAVHGYPQVLNFVTAHSFDPIVPTAEQWAALSDAQEWEVLETDPIEARITYSLEGHVLTLRIDENLDVVDVTETGRPDGDDER